MTVLFDTTILIDILRGHPGAVGFAGRLDETPACSEISRVEVMRGLRSSERTNAERLLQACRWVAVNEDIARRAGELGRSYRRSHPGLSTADLVIGATALEVGADLATQNVKHFPMFRGLRPPYRG